MRVRRWLWALALLVSPACGPLARPPRLLVLWHALDRERAAALARLTEAYMAEHPESAIYIEAFPGPAELRARLERPSERGPDLLVVPAEMVPDLFQAGRLVPLARWLEDPTLGLPPEERGDLLAPLTPGSVPFLREGLLLYADLDRLMESGFDQPPADWEAVRQVCVRGALDLNGDGRPDTAGWVAPRDGWVLQGWLAGRSRRSAQGILERVQTMLRWGCAQLLEPSTALRMFVQGETAMLFGPSRWLPELERKAAAGRLRFRPRLPIARISSGRSSPAGVGIWPSPLPIPVSSRRPGPSSAGPSARRCRPDGPRRPTAFPSVGRWGSGSGGSWDRRPCSPRWWSGRWRDTRRGPGSMAGRPLA